MCERNKSRRPHYGHGSELHEHHIDPKHNGGTDDPNNLTYLSPREHQIAHYLLWKMYRNPNDLRAMHMLGARLTFTQRKIVGEFCRDNEIGFFSEAYRNSFEHNSIRTKKSSATCKARGVGIFDKTMKSTWAAEAGKIGGKRQKELGIGIHNPDTIKKHASLGGKAIKGFKMMSKPGHKTRVHPSKVQQMLDEGYSMGWSSFDSES